MLLHNHRLGAPEEGFRAVQSPIAACTLSRARFQLVGGREEKESSSGAIPLRAGPSFLFGELPNFFLASPETCKSAVARSARWLHESTDVHRCVPPAASSTRRRFILAADTTTLDRFSTGHQPVPPSRLATTLHPPPTPPLHCTRRACQHAHACQGVLNASASLIVTSLFPLPPLAAAHAYIQHIAPGTFANTRRLTSPVCVSASACAPVNQSARLPAAHTLAHHWHPQRPLTQTPGSCVAKERSVPGRATAHISSAVPATGPIDLVDFPLSAGPPVRQLRRAIHVPHPSAPCRIAGASPLDVRPVVVTRARDTRH